MDLALEKCVAAEKEEGRGNHMRALMLYGQSVLRAPSTSKLFSMILKNTFYDLSFFLENTLDSTKTQAVSLWQRAQLLITMELYTEALADIKLALAEGLPAKYKGEAFWKMGICHKACGENEKSRVCFELAEKLLEDKEGLKNDREKEWLKEDEKNKKG